MFWSRTHSSLKDLPPSTTSGQQICAAHALADLLKRTYPHLHEQICELQTNVISNQQLLADIQGQQQILSTDSRSDGKPIDQTRANDLVAQERAALQNLDETMQSLLDLRHKGRMAK